MGSPCCGWLAGGPQALSIPSRLSGKYFARRQQFSAVTRFARAGTADRLGNIDRQGTLNLLKRPQHLVTKSGQEGERRCPVAVSLWVSSLPALLRRFCSPPAAPDRYQQRHDDRQ